MVTFDKTDTPKGCRQMRKCPECDDGLIESRDGTYMPCSVCHRWLSVGVPPGRNTPERTITHALW